MKNNEKIEFGFDELIQLGKKERSDNNNEAVFLILNPLGSMVLRELLGLEDTIELPKKYKGLEIVYTQDQYAEVARVY
jgi:hypothetical protein